MGQIFLETYGCQMNEYDSQVLKSILSEHSFITDPEPADVILLNTCAVRENACNKIRSRIGDLKYLRSRGARIGILGCMAQSQREKLIQQCAVDFVVGPDNYRQLKDLVDGKSQTKVMAEHDEYESYSGITPVRGEIPCAWLAIMRGCNNFCSFCVVPYTRGRERSKPYQEVIEEVQSLSSQGYSQVTLLGQNVNSYKSEGYTFTDLMRGIGEIGGVDRVRFTSPHPKDFPVELLEVIASHPNLCKQIHLPVQSGSDQVLKKMLRGYSSKEFLEIAKRIRDVLPDAYLSTDIIVGFPGETHDDFLRTRELMKEVSFESSYIFKYSPREHTLANKKYQDDVSAEQKTSRIVELVDLQKEMTSRALESMMGKKLEILVENESTRISADQCQGRCDQGVMVVIKQDGKIKKGDMLKAEIYEKTSHVLLGKTIH